MSRSVRRDGLPAWMLSPDVILPPLLVVFVFLGIFTTVPHQLVRFFSGEKFASDCYPAGREPIVSRRAHFDPRNTFVDSPKVRNRTFKEMELAIQATNYCRVGNCPPAAQKAYARAIRDYVKRRAEGHAHMFRSYGDPGLDYIRRIYSSIPHQRIVDGMKERHAAGLFASEDAFGASRAADLLIRLPASEFGPCRVDK